MSRVRWDNYLDRSYEIGISRVLMHFDEYTMVPWNGVVSITEAPSTADTPPIYQDGFRVYNGKALATYSASIEAFTYPDRLDAIFDQVRPNWFDFSYRTETAGLGYKLHLVYNCVISETDKSYSTLSNTIDVEPFSWNVHATPNRDHDGVPSTAHLIIDSSKVSDEDLRKIEDILYGTYLTEPRFPTPFEIRYILGGYHPFEIVHTPETGLSPLIDSETYSDLAGNKAIGLYRKTPETRLHNRDLPPGFNRLD